MVDTVNFFFAVLDEFSRYQEVEKVSIAESNVPRQLSSADQLCMEVFTDKDIP